jgi:uncharacterized membrane protein
VTVPARLAVVGLLSLGYVLGSHWLMTRDALSPWNAVGLITPMLAVAAFGTWRAGQHGRSLVLLALIAALVGQALTGVRVAPPLLYLGQHVGIHLMLALWFGSTLRAGEEPMIAVLAMRVHGQLSADMARYCRHVTLTWVLYFLGMAAVSALLFATAPFETWAVFANLLTPLSLVALFVGERAVRYRLHPEFERASLLDAVRAYGTTPAPQPAAGSPTEAGR